MAKAAEFCRARIKCGGLNVAVQAFGYNHHMKHMIGHSILFRLLPGLLLAFITTPILANNITISDYFPAGGPVMDASPVGCRQFETQPYMEAGSISVSKVVLCSSVGLGFL